MAKPKIERCETLVEPTMYPHLKLTPVLERKGVFVWIKHVEVDWGGEKQTFVPFRAHLETCHDTLPDGEMFACSECGTVSGVTILSPSGGMTRLPRYCPACGRRVVGCGE